MHHGGPSGEKAALGGVGLGANAGMQGGSPLLHLEKEAWTGLTPAPASLQGGAWDEGGGSARRASAGAAPFRPAPEAWTRVGVASSEGRGNGAWPNPGSLNPRAAGGSTAWPGSRAWSRLRGRGLWAADSGSLREEARLMGAWL